MNGPIDAIDVCAGAGGLSAGLQCAGFDVRGVEINADAVDTHRRHVGPCERASAKTWIPPSAVLVAGGVPCTPFSPAGLRLGVEDPRYLVPDFLRIAVMAGAVATCLENSAGLVTNRGGEDFRTVLWEFSRRGWHAIWRVLDAADFGVPQHRRRVFVVGFRDPVLAEAFRWPKPTHGPVSASGTPYRTVREALGLGDRVLRHGLKEGAKACSPQGMRLLNPDAPAPTVGGSVADLLDQPAPCVTATEHKSAMNGTQPTHRRRRASERLSDALALAGLADRPAITVQADARLNVARHHERQPHGAVRLTPAQCAALQDFPPDWIFTGTKSSQYRQIGNAVPRALAAAVGRSLFAVLSRPNPAPPK